MSRENRRRRQAAVAGGVLPEPRPRAALVAEPAGGVRIAWLPVLAGIAVGEALLLIVGDGGLALANAAFGGGGPQGVDGGVLGVATFVSVILGAFLAARLAGHHGIAQGMAVGIGFIAIAMVYQFVQEAQIVHSAISAGTHSLVDLGPMNLGGLMAGDLLALGGGSVGGWFAARR